MVGEVLLEKLRDLEIFSEEVRGWAMAYRVGGRGRWGSAYRV